MNDKVSRDISCKLVVAVLTVHVVLDKNNLNKSDRIHCHNSCMGGGYVYIIRSYIVKYLQWCLRQYNMLKVALQE